MIKFNKAQIERHIKSHSERSVIDCDAVSTLEYFFKSDGRINTNFVRRDTWPNIDGNFELVPRPEFSRRPVQNFVVQIKGTNSEAIEKNGCVKYHLDSLGFPAYVYCETTLDPSILFVVFNAKEKGKERIFWKYMSVQFLRSIDFSNDSTTITFTHDDEIKNTNADIDSFVSHLTKISDRHSFVKKLEDIQFTRDNVIRVIQTCDKQICAAISRIEVLNETRDDVSKIMLTRLDDLCTSVLLLHAITLGYDTPDIRLAWELSLMDINTSFLCTFLQSLRYIGRRIPEDGQTERLLLSYYDFLWQIRSFLKQEHNLLVLENLDAFPVDTDNDDGDYLQIVAETIDKVWHLSSGFHSLRYFIVRKNPFYINGVRYYELTLQLAEKYASKFNRLTVYTKINISTNYSIQIGYTEADLQLWGNTSKIKVVTNWKVSIDPSILNKFSSIFGFDLRLSSQFGEYNSLMDFLTKTGMNLLDLIDMGQERFDIALNNIYKEVNTKKFKEIIEILKKRFSEKSVERGRNTIRYLLLRLRENIIDSVVAKEADKKLTYTNLNIRSDCSPFEAKPLLYNLPKNNTNGKTPSRDVLRASGVKRVEQTLPYSRIKTYTEITGEIYAPLKVLSENNVSEIISQYNNSLSDWDRDNGKQIITDSEFAWIEDYEQTTLSILKKLLEHSKSGNDGQAQLNKNYLKEADSFEDEIKENALKNAFIDSKVMLIYGAAGTGKTTLINYISDLMKGRSKLFVTKTHTALENLQRRISAPGQSSKFITIDSFNRRKESAGYNIVFLDECSTIDNRSMLEFLNLIDKNSLIVLAGDIYQIESIEFGNWFYYVKNIIKPQSVVELTNTWRTEEENLKGLWEEVRNRDILVATKLVIDGPFSKDIGETLFEKMAEDEVVLCLNYDGRYGLNNVNSYFQDANKNGDAVHWHEWKYKVGDPILFNENRRFPFLYNNLKGNIINVIRNEDTITFTVEVNIILTKIDIIGSDLEIIARSDTSTQVRFTVFDKHGGATEEEKEENSMKSIIPFQLAYAVSIHKSQGLEYDSIKIVIPKSNTDKISHGIFYTAITRAKKYLKIFWSAETMQKVIDEFIYSENGNYSFEIIKSKLLNT